MKKNVIKGFKGFEKDLTCRGFQYEVGKTYEMEDDIEICSKGFHFCKKFWSVNDYYNFSNDSYRYCEIEALGKVIDEDNKSVTNKIKIVREIPKEEFIESVNIGNENTGFCNTGDCNTGNRNTGDWNTGNRNTGDWNTGNWNTGDWNKTNRSSGVFCNQEPKLIMFNKETDMSYEEWENTRAYDVLQQIEKSKWIYFSDMTDEEKEKYPSAETCDGYLKEMVRKEAVKEWWNNLSNYDKQEIFSLPNFDLDVFNDIMESEISKEEYDEVMKDVNK